MVTTDPLQYVVYFPTNEVNCQVLDRMEIEWLILADAAEVVNNKLYLMGGGWNRITANAGLPLEKTFGIAVSILVPWNQTNERQQFEIEFANGDGKSLAKVSGAFEVGRPPGITKGIVQRAQQALTISLKGLDQGTYEAIARLIGYPESERRFEFVVVPGQGVGRT